MPKSMFALEPGGPKRLEISWKAFWKNFVVTLDGKEIGRLEGKAELDKGQDFALPDRSTLHVQLVKSAMNVELQVTRNGAPLPGSASDPHQRIRNATYLLYFLAAVNTVLGVVALAIKSDAMENMGLGIGSIIMAVILAVLGFFTYRRSRVALVLATVLYGLDGVYTLVSSVGPGQTPPMGMIIVRVLFLMWLIRGVQAMNQLKRQELGGGAATA